LPFATNAVNDESAVATAAARLLFAVMMVSSCIAIALADTTTNASIDTATTTSTSVKPLPLALLMPVEYRGAPIFMES
jgi:ABC-type tungstate transport system permease subunit